MEQKYTDKSPIDCLLVSYDCTKGENSICIVGRRLSDGKMEIVNAFQGEKATEIYRMLTKTQQEGE